MSVTHIAERQYQELIGVLSDSLPMHALGKEDVTLKQDELEIVIRYHGGSDFVAESLECARDRSGTTGFETLAVRVAAGDLEGAVRMCGLAVMAAAMDYAASLVIRDVEALRDREGRPNKYDRKQWEAERYFEPNGPEAA